MSDDKDCVVSMDDVIRYIENVIHRLNNSGSWLPLIDVHTRSADALKTIVVRMSARIRRGSGQIHEECMEALLDPGIIRMKLPAIEETCETVAYDFVKSLARSTFYTAIKTKKKS